MYTLTGTVSLNWASPFNHVYNVYILERWRISKKISGVSKKKIYIYIISCVSSYVFRNFSLSLQFWDPKLRGILPASYRPVARASAHAGPSAGACLSADLPWKLLAKPAGSFRLGP